MQKTLLPSIQQRILVRGNKFLKQLKLVGTESAMNRMVGRAVNPAVPHMQNDVLNANYREFFLLFRHIV